MEIITTRNSIPGILSQGSMLLNPETTEKLTPSRNLKKFVIRVILSEITGSQF